LVCPPRSGLSNCSNWRILAQWKSSAAENEGDGDDRSLKDESSGNDESDSNNEDANDDENEFPDVQVDFKSMHLPDSAHDEEFSVINLAPSTKPVKKTETDKYLEEKNAAAAALSEQQEKAAKPMNKRQKHKLEKIRKKYKDQDEEERKIRMELLHGPAEAKNKSKTIEESTPTIKEKPKVTPVESTSEEKSEKEAQMPIEDDQAVEEEQALENIQDELAIIDALTCAPSTDDGVLFVLPVCGPYSAMQKFKYKVKVTPGTGKRGKAVKMALSLFSRDKTITQAERALIKNLVMDDHVAQNIPGKVRVSAPMLNTKAK